MAKHGNEELVLISECCEAEAIFEPIEGEGGWYVCTQCHQPCELIGYVEEEKSCYN